MTRRCRLCLLGCVLIPLLVGSEMGRAGGAQVPVGSYLYAKPANPERFEASLTVTFSTPGDKMVIAYGRKYRKDRKAREDTTEADREMFKPYLATMSANGTKAVFPHLPADFYDLVVIQAGKVMRLDEGLSLLQDSKPEAATDQFMAEVKQSLDVTKDKIGGWEAFFDTKEFDRLESDGVRGCVLVQQKRLGKSFAESGAPIEGCIHSIDICWVERGKKEGVGWQVVTRQQLYRDEIASRDFFKHKFVPELQGVRVGGKARTFGPIALP